MDEATSMTSANVDTSAFDATSHGLAHSGLLGGQAGCSTKASNLRAGPPKASIEHGGTTAVTYRSDEAWSMELRCDSITGLGAAARPALVECNFSKFYIAMLD